MKLKYYLLLSLIFWAAAHTNSYAQFQKEIKVYPYKGTRYADSLKVEVKRVVELLKAHRFFERSYLHKKVVFMPVGEQYANRFSSAKPYFAEKEFLPLLGTDTSLSKKYRQLNDRLNSLIKRDNKIAEEKNAAYHAMEKMAKVNPNLQQQAQNGLYDFYYRKNYLVVMCPGRLFTYLSPEDPRHNFLPDSVEGKIRQDLLGKPFNLDGYVNSINYIPFTTGGAKMPQIIRLLIEQNLALWKKIIREKDFHALVANTTIDDHMMDYSGKLWLNTDVKKQVIYLSPYLVRAVFNISFYQDSILRVANQLVQDTDSPDDIKVFFEHKHDVSIQKIDAHYYGDFVERFSKNLFFVLGHELAHIYLAGKYPFAQMETACDTYAAYYYLRQFKKLDMGVFETLLISAIKTNELRFWGQGINHKSLEERYANLRHIQATRSFKSSRLSPVIH